MIPESPEVIGQAARQLYRLVTNINDDGEIEEDKKDQLHEQLHMVTDDYNRAGRVAAFLAYGIKKALNEKYRAARGGRPVDGVNVEFDHEPAPFEVAYVAYLNNMLSGNVAEAQSVFSDMVASEPEEDIQSFILSLARFSSHLKSRA